MAGLTKVKGSGLATGAATASLVGIDDNATSTKLTISDTNITGVGAFTSTSIDATKLSGALPAIDGSALTGMAGGKVLQVVSATINTEIVNTTEGANVDLMSLAITPSSSSSKILVMLNWMEGQSNPNGAYRLYRGSTSLVNAAAGYDGGTGFWAYDDVGASSIYQMESKIFTYLDSPNTTSATTYKLSTDSSASVYFNRSVSSSGHGNSTITLMEIGA